MAESLFGDARAVVKIDLRRIPAQHEIAKLIGSDPDTWGTGRLILCSRRKRSININRATQAFLVAFRRDREGQRRARGNCSRILDKAHLRLGTIVASIFRNA